MVAKLMTWLANVTGATYFYIDLFMHCTFTFNIYIYI